MERGKFPGMKALILVHLSSLDNYAEFSFDATGVYDQAWRLAERIAKAAHEFAGPLYIVDQNWKFLGEKNDEPRQWLWNELEVRPDAVWIHFDEDYQDWKVFLPKFLKRLKKDKITQAVMGGVWHDPSLKVGCVTTTYLYLKMNGIKARVDRALVGCETDYGPEGDPNFLFRK